jgi:hypothetical protein
MRANKLNILKAFTVFSFFLGLVGWFLPFSSFFYSRPWIESSNTKRHGIALDLIPLVPIRAFHCIALSIASNLGCERGFRCGFVVLNAGFKENIID